MYFSYNADDGFTLHKTAVEARYEAVEALEFERGEAKVNGEWNEDVEEICWGKVAERVVQTESGPEYFDFGLVASMEEKL